MGRGEGCTDGLPVGHGLRGGRQLSSKGIVVGLVVNRLPGVARGDAKITIKAYDSEGGIGGRPIAEAGPDSMRGALISISGPLFAHFHRTLND
jgi:hypothetical protein